MKTTRNIITAALLFTAALFISSCTSKSENTGTPSTAANESAAAPDSAKQSAETEPNASANEKFTYQLIASEKGTWGYDIYSGGKLMKWGLILLALLTLSLVSAALVQRQPLLAGVPAGFSVSSFRIPFDKAGYFSVLKFLVPVAIAGFFIVHFTIGTNGLLDFAGTMVSAVVVGYIVHLIIGNKK